MRRQKQLPCWIPAEALPATDRVGRPTFSEKEMEDWNLQNPFGESPKVDWLVVGVVALLVAAGVFFVAAMRLIAAAI